MFFSKPKRAAVLDNGIYDLRKHEVCRVAAYHTNGTCYVAEGRRLDGEFLKLQDAAVKQGLIERPKVYVERSLEEIAEYYEGQSRDINHAASDGQKTSGERRLLRLIEAAASMKASDIRIIQHDTYTTVRIRVAGQEIDYGHNWTPEEGETAISSAFAMQSGGSGESSMIREQFQSFSISPQDKFPLPRNVVKLRVQKGYHESDTKIGISLVARLFYDESGDTGTLEDLGLDEEVLGAMARARDNLKGCLLIGGETGDGKSTTLVRALEQAYDDHQGRISIVTLEDPVEYRIRRTGVQQIPLRSAGDDGTRESNYRAALRNFVRMNPDLGMIAEVRDGAGGREVLQFASTGHGLYSTIHVDSANGIPFRMIALGVPAEEICQTGILRLLLKQTLVPILCPECKLPLSQADLNPSQARQLAPLKGTFDQVFLRNEAGCEACCGKFEDARGMRAWAGYTRLSAVAEFIEPDDTYNSFVRTNDANGARAYWLRPKEEGGMGGVELAQKTTELVLQGQLDPFDCLRRKGDLTKRLSAPQRARLAWAGD